MLSQAAKLAARCRHGRHGGDHRLSSGSRYRNFQLCHTHAVIVAVDPETGDVKILDYVVVEDGGKLVNPMVADGQILGGLAQGIGTALFEEMPFDASAQPLASTLADYLLSGSTDVPATRIDHLETLAPHTEFGVEGIGEGGAIAAPAAIANAVNVLSVPYTPNFWFRQSHRIGRLSVFVGSIKHAQRHSSSVRPDWKTITVCPEKWRRFVGCACYESIPGGPKDEAALSARSG
jgi:hypothetical protein